MSFFHRLTKRYFGKQLPSTLRKVYFFLSFSPPVSMAIQNICETQMCGIVQGMENGSTRTDHQHVEHNEMFAFRYIAPYAHRFTHSPLLNYQKL